MIPDNTNHDTLAIYADYAEESGKDTREFREYLIIPILFRQIGYEHLLHTYLENRGTIGGAGVNEVGGDFSIHNRVGNFQHDQAGSGIFLGDRVRGCFNSVGTENHF